MAPCSFPYAYSLRAILTLFIVAPHWCYLAIAGYFTLLELEYYTEKRMQEDVELIAQAIRLPLSHTLERGQKESMKQALNSAFRIDRVYGAYVYGTHGEKVAVTGAKNRVFRAESLPVYQQKEISRTT